MILDPRQMDNIVKLIIDICAKAESRGEVTKEEREAILQFTSNATMSNKTLQKILSGEIRL